MGVEEEMFVAPDLAPSPVSSPKKLRRLRKVRILSEDASAMATATSQADEIVSSQENRSEDITIASPSSDVIRESAEDILRRFGKEDRTVGENAASLVDVGKKRKAVQSTIRAAVVDMAKETLKVIQETQASEEGGGHTIPNVDSAEVDLELASHEEQGDDICQGNIPSEQNASGNGYALRIKSG